MAIFPVRSNYVIDVDAFTSASYKAGMAIVRDDNGRAIVADSQQLVFKNIYQKSGKFLGFAASDHDVSGNTIIRPDVVGSSYLDSSYGYVQFKDNEFLSPKRALADNLDETASKFYNNTEILSTTRRGIGVYNQPGEIYITDQFSPVLHGDYGVDGLDTQTLNPGDLLTFGGGVNAGKLVKVNLNSLGPDVLVVGQVEKYVSQTGLLHFRLVSYSLSFGTDNLKLFYDFGNPASYTTGTTVYDLSSNGKNGLIQNGPVFTNSGSASFFTFDHADDVIETSTNNTGFGINSSSFTFEAVYSVSSVVGDNMVFGSTISGTGRRIHFGTRGTAFHMGNYANDKQLNYGLVTNTIYYVSYISDYSLGYSKIFVNGVMSGNIGGLVDITGTGPIGVGGRSYAAHNGQFGGRLYMARIYNRALTNTEVLNQYNATKSRYGL